MKFSYTSKDGQIGFDFDANTPQEAFKKIADFQEIFENDAAADVGGKFVGPKEAGEVRYVVRNVAYTDEKGKPKQATYYEKRVISGPMKGYRKDYGLLEDGSGMFPKKAPTEKSVPGFNNWYKYDANA